jgi:hypothetical protein
MALQSFLLVLFPPFKYYYIELNLAYEKVYFISIVGP